MVALQVWCTATLILGIIINRGNDLSAEEDCSTAILSLQDILRLPNLHAQVLPQGLFRDQKWHAWSRLLLQGPTINLTFPLTLMSLRVS